MDVENDSSLRIDEQVFKNLFDKFYQALCVFASTYLKDDALSADIVQEGFVKFWNKREGLLSRNSSPRLKSMCPSNLKWILLSAKKQTKIHFAVFSKNWNLERSSIGMD